MAGELALRSGLLATPAARREIKVARAQGRVSAARIQGMAVAAQTALIAAGSLSAMETTLIQTVPLGEPRYKAIVDAFSVSAANELYMMSIQ